MLFILAFIFIFGGYVSSCPPEEVISPCDCKSFLQTPVVTCKDLFNPEELVEPVQSTAIFGAYVEALIIENSSLLYIPNSAFENTKFQRILFLHSEIFSLSDTDVAFEGLENTLTEIRAKDADYVAQWDWNQLRNLRNLETIDINWIPLGSISQKFPSLNNLRFLGIIHAHVSFIVDYAFYKLKNLSVLNLKENDLTELKRNMLPEPAYNLITIDFSENKLATLPKNFFTLMPKLADVKLDNNKFITLYESIFSSALQNLDDLTMTGNPFRCDCRMRWLVGVEKPYVFAGDCATPAKLAGTPIRSLNIKTLRC